VLFEPLADLNALDLADFRIAIRDQFSRVEELSPLAPWSAHEEGISFVPNEAKWPMPACLFSNETRDHQIYVQNDRIGLAWTFSEHSTEYPGFHKLLADLAEYFRLLTASIQGSGQPEPAPRRVNLRYTNQIKHVRAHAMASAILHGWPLIEAHPRFVPSATSIRLQQEASEENGNISTLLLVDSDVFDMPADQEDIDSCMLRVGADADVTDGEDFRSKLTAAHNAVISTFMSVTNEEMQQKWGPINA
jgi:uncharacterized protein (TIGR04255 family)